MSAQIPDVGRPKGAAWRHLQDEGIVWEGQVLITGDDTDLAALLIVTNQRLAFIRGGSVALDIDRDWLDPAPVLRRTGTVQLWVTPPEDPIAESLTFIARDGRDEAAVLLSLINDSGSFGAAYRLPAYVPDALPPDPGYPTAPSRRHDGWGNPGYEQRPAPLPVYSLLDDDDFPPVVTDSDTMPAWESAIAEALEPGTMLPLAGSIRNPNGPIRPIDGFDSKYARDRRSWVIRLVGLFLLVGIGSVIASGILPSANDVQGWIDNDPTPETIAQNTQQTPTPTNEATGEEPAAEATRTGPSSSDPRDPTVVPIETAIALGVGGDDTHTPPPPTETAEPTATATATAEQQQSSSGVPSGENPSVTEAEIEESVTAVIPAPDEDFSPTATATAEPSPTEEPVVESPTEESVTQEPVDELADEPDGASKVQLDGLTLTIDEQYRGERLPDLTLGRNSVGEWVVILVHVVNDSGEPIEMPMSAIGLAPASDLSAPVPLDSASSAVASYLEMTPTVRSDASAIIPAGGAQPLALVFSIPTGLGDLKLLFGDEQIDLSGNTAAEASLLVEPMGFDFVVDRRSTAIGDLVAARSTPVQTASDSRLTGWLAGEAAVAVTPTSAA